ncbi:TRAP transporter small permease subunit [Alphaproteobacteria bacterium GH1-50]|uniref:TRAP transporter small permease protein n=1 Tax=Kangsaoukella pontilimi TaxID=2691042 RepID=A0A7C9MHV4_9RHOB|nr:TRAP transporter small permease subunit [Kangsaoukella pontilimi]MXQ09256.1 TRAP transporter small permease subunit [Kangsaoukella pontilimi]
MTYVFRAFSRTAEFIAAMMMAAMFATFIIQITIRYTARLDWLAERFPFLDPSLYGWTLEFCLLMWVWIVFWGNAFVVRERDHVTFDIIYHAASPKVRKWFAIIGGIAVTIALAASIPETWDRFAILRLKRTATLDSLFGDWIRMRHIYAIYILFMVAVALRYAWRAVHAWRHGAEDDLYHYEDLVEDVKDGPRP